MELSFDTLKTAVTGAVRIIEEEKILKFKRFAVGQEEFLKGNPDGVGNSYIKGNATSGVTVDFYTDSEILEYDLSCEVAVTSQNCCFTDVLADGEIVAHEGYFGHRNEEISVRVALKKGRKRVTVYLPNLFVVGIKRFVLSDGAEFTPYKHKMTFLFIGDSITQGYTADYPSNSYVNAVTRLFDARCINHGIGGAVFNAGLLSADIGGVPDAVFVAYGTNDWEKGKNVSAAAKTFAEKIVKLFSRSEIFAITPIWRGKIEETERRAFTSFIEMQERLKNAYALFPKIHVVDGTELVPHEEKYFLADILHPNDIGFKYYAENLFKKVKEVL